MNGYTDEIYKSHGDGISWVTRNGHGGRVTVPDDHVGTVTGDLNSRRGRIQDMDVKGHNEILKAHVPLAEMLTSAPMLILLTAGKGIYRMEFFGYEDVPKEMVRRIVEEHKKEAVASTS